MERFTGFLGIALILGIAFAMSNNRKAINLRLVLSGLALQLTLAIIILKVGPVREFFRFLGHGMEKIEGFAREGAKFVLGGTLPDAGELGKVFGPGRGFIFAFNIPATIILVCVLVAILYHVGIMQRVVAVIARGVNVIMGASGAEALSNVASAFVGQVEAQVMIRPYLNGMTNSELLASMSGSMACIAGGILIVYVNMGIPAEYLITASLMAAPGALVISKIVYPETADSQTKGKVTLHVKSQYSNLIDAISHGAADGMKISINVIAMLIGFIALIAFVNFVLAKLNVLAGSPMAEFSLNTIFGWIFYPLAWCMGVPSQDVHQVAVLMGQKISINEFVAYLNLKDIQSTLTPKAMLIASFALCGFANFSSVGMQIGGIGELAPHRREDLAKLGIRALICGTLASYLSATIAGILS
ncbi:MAG TPA: nucleoside transporter C-terminal domain-containing protein [Chitinophagales bacterium]|nr:nucleoside transporter C-terminal domain-containing protein [Chitinophagales bacterium]